MKNKLRDKLHKWLIILLMLVFLPQLSPAQQAEGEIKTLSLTLEECILQALENNLDIKIEVLNPEISKVSVTGAKEKFLPQFTFTVGKRNTETASYSWLDSSTQVKTQYQTNQGEFSQFLPTGGTLVLRLNIDETETTQKFQTINPRYESSLRINLTQPLLKNFGINTNRKQIIVARNNLKISQAAFRSALQDTIYSVEEAYWNLVYSIENLKVKQQSLKLARELLVKNERSVEIGKLAPIEVTSARAEVATREADILQAEAQVHSDEDRLKTLINIKTDTPLDSIQVLPVDQPRRVEKIIDLAGAVQIAMENRPDLEQRKIELKNRETEVWYAKNQLLPDLNLQASYWSPGISGTRILYKDNNPLTGEIIGYLPGDSSEAFKDTFKLLYPNWSVNLALNIPMSSIFTRTQLAAARLQSEQSRLQVENMEQQILLEIKNAIRQVQTNYKRIDAYQLALELTEKKLAAEEEKLKVGNSTNYNVFLFQRDLAAAQDNELKAVIDYNLSLANQERVLGITLKEKNIQFKFE